MKIAVIVSDASHMIHAGLDVVRTVKMFDLPEDISQYIKKNKQAYVTVTVALEDDAPEVPATTRDAGDGEVRS